MPLNFAGHFFVGLRGDDFKTFVAILTAGFEVAFQFRRSLAINGNSGNLFVVTMPMRGILAKHFFTFSLSPIS